MTNGRISIKLLILLGTANVYIQIIRNSFTKDIVRELAAGKVQAAPKRVAAVWATVGLLTDCEASRLRHLVETAGMDVWILPAHHILEAQGRQDEIAASNQRIASIPELHKAPQRDTPILPFDGLSGSSKSSFLQFVVDHPEYDYVWNVESDMFFTGSWNEIFQSEEASTMDFLSGSIVNRTGTRWYWLLPQKNCTVFQQNCRDIKAVQTGWMFSRVSSRLSNQLLQDVFMDHVRGHHEAIVGPYCALKNFTYGLVDPSWIGSIDYGHRWGQDDGKLDVASFDPQPRTLLHPVKCVAYYAPNDHTIKHHPVNKTIQSDIDKFAASSVNHELRIVEDASGTRAQNMETNEAEI
jgi:Protein of unknown function (DUF3405)